MEIAKKKTRSMTRPFRVAGLFKLFAIAIVLFCGYYMIPCSDESPAWSHGFSSSWSHLTAHSTRPNTDGFNRVLGITQWGEIGNRVRVLSRWAQYLVDNPQADRQEFENILASQFPFLADTEDKIYTPWSTAFIPTDSSFQPGLVICTGSNNFHHAAHLITTLRRVLHSKIPIEIMYAGDQDLRLEHRLYLRDIATAEYKITFVDLLERFPWANFDLTNSAGWAVKPFALLASAHRQAILVDADALFLTAPDDLFDTHRDLARTGTLFFHDRGAMGAESDMARQNWVKNQLEAVGREPSQSLARDSLFWNGTSWYEADSGVVAMDKSRPEVIMGLIFATWMNTKIVRDEVTYQNFHGDKETFWLAMELSGFEYFFHPWYAGTVGKANVEGLRVNRNGSFTEDVEICGKHMLHLGHSGTTPFWLNGGIYEDKDDLSKGYAEMTHFWVHDYKTQQQLNTGWYWIENNIGCIKEKGVRALSDDMKMKLERMQMEAKRVDGIIRHG